MERKRQIIIIIIAVVVIILIAILLFWFFQRRGGEQPPTTNTNQPFIPPEQLPVASGDSELEAAEIGEPETEATLKSLAKTFAERFGSFSNQSNFINLDDLRDSMTLRMRSWADGYIQQQQAETRDDQPFYGVTTVALSATITSFDESLGRATVVISTQRQESKSTTVNPRILYQKLELKMVSTSEGWKVDEAAWL